MADALKPIVLVLLGLIVLLGYVATMVFGLKAVFWLALILTPLVFVQLLVWGR